MPTKPMFPETTSGNILFAWLGIAGNAAVVAIAAYSLVAQYSHVGPDWRHIAMAVLAGLFFLDLFSGFVHWFSDTWLDENTPGFQRTFSVAREHHICPQNITGYGTRDLVAYSTWPAFVVLGPAMITASVSGPTTLGSYVALTIGLMVCLGMFLGSHCHLLAHKHSHSPVVRLLQRTRILIPPSYHRVHHSGRHDIRYAVINGWSNVICDSIGFWRALEAIVQRSTGATPRRSDLEWRGRPQRPLEG